ncbi:MAG TPA: hypothetical protein VGE51_02775 [Fontimonas sp.]
MKLSPSGFGLIASALLGASPALADASSAAGLRVGSGGIVVEYAHRLNDYVDLRGGYAFGSFNRDFNEDGIDYDGDIRFKAAQAMIDIKPFAGGFRVSAGLYSSAPEVTLETVGNNDQYEIGGREYTATGRLDGDIDFGSAAPYLGLGWGGTTGGSGFGLSFDAGVMFAAAPSVALRAQGDACESTLIPCDPTGPTGFDVNSNDPRAVEFRNQLDNERAEVEEDIEDLRYWPVVSLGLHYRW